MQEIVFRTTQEEPLLVKMYVFVFEQKFVLL